jgi:polyhydroxyalkanoate synthesis regulator phasin
MAKRPATPRELPDALREAVERTVEATVGSAERSRASAQGALDDMVQSVDELRKGAEERLAKSRRSVADALEGRRPATSDDLKELKAELRAIGRRLDAIEDRLPVRRAPAKKRAPARKPAAKKPARAKRSSS